MNDHFAVRPLSERIQDVVTRQYEILRKGCFKSKRIGEKTHDYLVRVFNALTKMVKYAISQLTRRQVDEKLIDRLTLEFIQVKVLA